jgi:hypothetical protein
LDPPGNTFISSNTCVSRKEILEECQKYIHVLSKDNGQLEEMLKDSHFSNFYLHMMAKCHHQIHHEVRSQARRMRVHTEDIRVMTEVLGLRDWHDIHHYCFGADEFSAGSAEFSAGSTKFSAGSAESSTKRPKYDDTFFRSLIRQEPPGLGDIIDGVLEAGECTAMESVYKRFRAMFPFIPNQPECRKYLLFLEELMAGRGDIGKLEDSDFSSIYLSLMKSCGETFENLKVKESDSFVKACGLVLDSVVLSTGIRWNIPLIDIEHISAKIAPKLEQVISFLLTRPKPCPKTLQILGQWYLVLNFDKWDYFDVDLWKQIKDYSDDESENSILKVYRTRAMVLEADGCLRRTVLSKYYQYRQLLILKLAEALSIG